MMSTARLERLTRTSMRLTVAGVVASCFLFQSAPLTAQATPTAPNTVISNTATATYTDANNVNYTTNSNTLTTTVQNAPSLSDAGSANQFVSPGETVTDTFTVTDTGNAAGAITMVAPTISNGITPSNAYVLSGAATGTCSIAAPCTLTVLNNQGALSAAVIGTAITIGVEYVVPTATSPGTAITDTLTGTILQAAVGAAPAVTSLVATATDTDNSKADARLDLFKSASTPASSSVPITYTIDGNNGGGFGAQALVSAGNLLGLSNVPGLIAVLDAVPRFSGATTQTTLNAAPAVPALPSGDTGTMYYTTDSAGLTGWSTTFNSAASYVALFVTTTNAGGIVFPSAPSGSSGGAIAQTTPQFVFTFAITQPTGNGSADSGALKNIANSVIGGNPGDAGTPIIAPNVPVATDYESTGTTFPASTFTTTLTNVTPSSGTIVPGGASNLVLSVAFGQPSVLNGPLGSAGAAGSYNGLIAGSTQNDFTAVGFVCTGGPTTAIAACAWPTGGVSIPSTVANTGNGSDTFNIYATAAAGYTVQLFGVTGCPTGTLTVLPIAPYGTGCTVSTAISPLSASGGSATTSAGITIAAGATFNYVAVYAPASATTTLPFTALNFSTIAYGTVATVTAGVPTLGADANQTYDVLYPGGVLQVTKTQAIVTNCSGTPAPVSSTAICPGGTITFTLVYKNVAPAALATGGAGVMTEPAFALNGLVLNTVVVADNGALGSNNWGSTTFGIDSSVAPVIPGGTTATYTPAVSLSTGTYPAKTQGPTKISVAIPGTLQPAATGTISFQVTVI
jgi:hypothetical protein